MNLGRKREQYWHGGRSKHKPSMLWNINIYIRWCTPERIKIVYLGSLYGQVVTDFHLTEMMRHSSLRIHLHFRNKAIHENNGYKVNVPPIELCWVIVEVGSQSHIYCEHSYLYDKFKVANIWVQSSRSIRFDNLFADAVLSPIKPDNKTSARTNNGTSKEYKAYKIDGRPATNVLPNGQTQHRGRRRKTKSELGDIMAELPSFN